ncbi:MAG TPA: ECF-type sigma factor [Vicinamibacterales bacterium]|nr:ECF-type sigma factor [Vicinamibacterales bacterium]
MPGDVTELLLAHGRGRADAMDQLVPLVYQDLRRVARSQLRRLRVGETLDTTGLVHEAYLRLVDQTRATWHDRGHFLAVSAIAMRQVLIDYARERSREKRGGGVVHTAFDDQAAAATVDAGRLLEIDLALEKLGRHDPRLVRVVECRYFAGLSEHETAEALGVSLRTAQRDWLKARAWLRQELGR